MRGLSENRLRGDSILRSRIPRMEKMDQKSYSSAAHEFLNAITEFISIWLNWEIKDQRAILEIAFSIKTI